MTRKMNSCLDSTAMKSRIIDPALTTRRYSVGDVVDRYVGRFSSAEWLSWTPVRCSDGVETDDTLWVIFAEDLLSLAENLAQAYRANHNLLIVIAGGDINLVSLRQTLRATCGESSLFICCDGVVAKTFDLKGFTLSLTMPVYNEEETIREVIESFLPVADEIIIGVDDKTDDATREIAALYADEVFSFTWRDNFASARNECLRRCSSRWIFMTEGHEFLSLESLDKVKFIGSLPADVNFVRVKRVYKEDNTNKTSVWPWITRNIPSISYKNASHNVVLSDVPSQNVSVDLLEIATIHVRSETKSIERSAQRRLMNRKNLRRGLISNKRDTRSMFYLANEEFDAGRYDEAASLYERYLKHSRWDQERYQAGINYARALRAADRPAKEIENILLGCFAEGICRNDHMIMLGDLYEDNDPERAIFHLRMAASVEQVPTPMWTIESYYREVPLQKLCIIYGRLGRLQEALSCAKLVREKFPDVSGSDEAINQIEAALNEEGRRWDQRESNLDIVAI